MPTPLEEAALAVQNSSQLYCRQRRDRGYNVCRRPGLMQPYPERLVPKAAPRKSRSQPAIPGWTPPPEYKGPAVSGWELGGRPRIKDAPKSETRLLLEEAKAPAPKVALGWPFWVGLGCAGIGAWMIWGRKGR